MTLCSAVLPTRGRRELAVQAVQSFLAQTYAHRELVILDDADEPSFVQGIEHPLIRYFRVDGQLNIPQKRNKVNALTSGQIIFHLDSDDWSAPTRMAAQVELLTSSGKSLCGFSSVLFLDTSTDKWFKYTAPLSGYAVGTSLTYLREWWMNNPFVEKMAIGSDNQMVKMARAANQIIAVDAGEFMFARAHSGNSDRKALTRRGYTPVDLSNVPQAFLQCQLIPS